MCPVFSVKYVSRLKLTSSVDGVTHLKNPKRGKVIKNNDIKKIFIIFDFLPRQVFILY